MKSGLVLFSLLLSLSCPKGGDAEDREPVGLRLSGHGKSYANTFRFEIVMEGFDRYYLKKWRGDPHDWDAGGFENLVVVVGKFDGAMSQSWSQWGSRGGGSHGQHGQYRGAVARRLWDGNRFSGVSRSALRAELAHDRFIEEFSKPVSREHFPTPCVIKWTNCTSAMAEKTTTYTIEKAECIYESNPEFFEAAKAECLRKVGTYNSAGRDEDVEKASRTLDKNGS